MIHHIGIKELNYGGQWAAFCSCGWDERPCTAAAAQSLALEHQGGKRQVNEKPRDRFNPLRAPRTGDGMTEEAFPGAK